MASHCSACFTPTLPYRTQQHRRRAAAQTARAQAEEWAPRPPAPPPAPAVPQLSSRAVPTRSGSQLDEAAKWTEQYKAQPQVPSSGSEAPFLLPLMTLRKCKLPTESVPLQLFESRYRLMFKLVNQSASRRFGVVLADSSTGQMESVGALCELTHFVVVPERRRVFVNARAIGRFSTQEVISDKPFLTVSASHYSDRPPQGLEEQLQLAAQELRVWEAMQEVKRLASKLFNSGSALGNDIFSLEVRRWCPDAEARADVPTAAGADPTLQRMVELAGLLGDSATLAERTTEYLCSDALKPTMADHERAERFSFALARSLDFTPECLQQLMYTQSTAERLRAAEELVMEGRAYLAARSTLKDAF